VSGTTKQNTGDSTYRDRAKERRDGIKNATTAEQQEDSWLSPTAPSDAATAEEEEATTTTTTTATPRFVSAADAKFDAVIKDFETQHSTTTNGKVSKQQRHDAKAESSTESSSLLPHRGLFATADQARQWVDGKLPALPAPQSDTAKRLVEYYLRTTTKLIEATPQHLSLHRTYYTFGTQWNPWWERPVINTFLDDGSSFSRHSNKRPWEPFSADILVQVGESCRRIAQREAERQQRAVAVSKGRDGDANTKTAVAQPESSDEDDDIFAGAGDYDAAVAIQETAPTNHDVATSAALGGGGASIFGVVAKNHYHLHHDASALPEPKPEGDDGAMRPLHGFSETVDTTAGVDMDYEIADVDPKKKKKKKRRKKGDDADSD
jgi:hypothetical protein